LVTKVYRKIEFLYTDAIKSQDHTHIQPRVIDTNLLYKDIQLKNLK